MVAPGTFAPFEVAKFGAASAVIPALMDADRRAGGFPPLPAGRGKGQEEAPPVCGVPRRCRLGGRGAEAGLGRVVFAVLALSHGVAPEHASEPGQMYAIAFGYIIPNQTLALILMAVFVVVSQLKINVMNAYAGSLAWSNFFAADA